MSTRRSQHSNATFECSRTERMTDFCGRSGAEELGHAHQTPRDSDSVKDQQRLDVNVGLFNTQRSSVTAFLHLLGSPGRLSQSATAVFRAAARL